MKFAGKVGFELYSEDVPGVYSSHIVEKPYRGTMEQELRRVYTSSETTADDIKLDNRIKIVANPYALQNYQSIKFVVHMGNCWKVKTVDVKYPDLLLYLGGVYNGERATTETS